MNEPTLSGSVGQRLLAAIATVLVMFVGLGAASASAATFTYSQAFTNGIASGPATAQGTAWTSYIAALPTAGVTSITLSGSNDPVGKTCNIPATAQQIADAIRTGAALSVTCGGDSWAVGQASPPTCGSGGDLAVNNGGVCSCGSAYSLRPLINNSNWGGINGATCGAASQTISLSVVTTPVPTLSPLMMGVLVAMIAGIGLWLAPRRYGGFA